MLGDQLSSMKSNQTSIDRLKNQKHDIRVDINEVCGSPLETNFQWRWLIPVAVSFSETLLDRIMGYRMSPKGGEYCIVCPSKEEATPLMDGEIELKAIEMTSESNKKESKSDATDNAPLPTPGTRPAVLSTEKQQVRADLGPESKLLNFLDAENLINSMHSKIFIDLLLADFNNVTVIVDIFF